MKKTYIAPEVNVISFASAETIATNWQPNEAWAFNTSANFFDIYYDEEE